MDFRLGRSFDPSLPYRPKVGLVRTSPPLGPLLILAFLAVAYTLSAHRPDADDEYYLSTTLRLMQRSHQKLQDFSFMDTAYSLLSYNSVEAALAFISKAPILGIYYFVFPAIAAFVSVFVSYRLFHSLVGQHAFLATLLFVVIVIMWGDGHRSPGNFSFVRLFQAKAVFCLLIVPALLIYSIEVYLHQSVSTIILLTLATSAGIGTTQTAVILVPLLLLMSAAFLVPNLKRNASLSSSRGVTGRSGVVVLIGVALVFTLAVGLLWNIGQTPQGRGTMLAPQTIDYTLGSGPRTFLAFFCLFLLPFLVDTRLRIAMTFLVVVAATVALSPMLALLVGWLSQSATWRIVWIIPFALAVALAITRLAHSHFVAKSQWAKSGTIAFALIVFALSGRPTFSPSNKISFHWPRYKTERPDEVMLRRFGRFAPIMGNRICITSSKCF